MYTLFETQRVPDPRFVFFSFNNLQRRWLENIDSLTQFYRTSGMAVDSRHVLARLVGSFSIPLYSDVRKYRDAILDLTPQLCMAHGIVAPTNSSPKTTGGWFYGLTDSEFLVSVDFGQDPVVAARNWTSLMPLRVIRNTMTDLNMQLPDGDVKDLSAGYAVLYIDIPLLGVMYRGWALENALRPSGEQQHIEQFIYQYVLPGALQSQTNVAWFNRILATYNKTPVGKERQSHSIAIPTNYSNLDRIASQILEQLDQQQLSFTELLGTIPAIKHSSMLGFLQPPDTVIGRQNQWALESAYVPYVSLAVAIDTDHGGTQNLLERNRLRRIVAHITNDRMFDPAPSRTRNDLRLDFQIQVGAYL